MQKCIVLWNNYFSVNDSFIDISEVGEEERPSTGFTSDKEGDDHGSVGKILEFFARFSAKYILQNRSFSLPKSNLDSNMSWVSEALCKKCMNGKKLYGFAYGY